MKNPAIIEEIWWIEDMRLGEITDNEKSTKKEINILKDSIVDNFYQVEGIWKFNNRSFIFEILWKGKWNENEYNLWITETNLNELGRMENL